MKKIIALLLMMVMSFSLLVGCGGNDNDTSDKNQNQNVSDNVQQDESQTDESEKEETPVATEYLADVVEIGDYVEIGVPYKNVHGKVAEQDGEVTTLTGWRVLEVEGSGETGVVKLVSAGNPLTYYHAWDGDRDITPYLEMLNNLNAEIELVGGEGFRSNGFENNNLTEVFSASEFVDMSKGIHAFGCASMEGGTETDGEFERLYAAITGNTLTMTQIDEIEEWKYLSNDVLGLTEEDAAYSLITNGAAYFLGGTPQYTYSYWEVGYGGWIDNSANITMGVRPVVTLQAGIKALQDDAGVWQLSK